MGADTSRTGRAGTSRTGVSGLLYYRAWRGPSHGPGWSVWPIARVALGMIFRRKLFWTLYGLGLVIFCFFFFGMYLLSWAQAQLGGEALPVGFVKLRPDEIIGFLKVRLKLDGSGETYRNYFWYQGYAVMALLALAGSILVGNDFHFGSLPFYLSKPLWRWHYLLGKCLAVAVFINLMTTLPACVLFVEHGLLDSWISARQELRTRVGILGYGGVLTVCLSLLLVATASWLRRTVPLIMLWTTLLFFLRLLAGALVDGLHYDARWRLIDIWNNMYLVGNFLLGIAHEVLKPLPQPAYTEAALVLGALCLLCLTYLTLRIRAVEIVR